MRINIAVLALFGLVAAAATPMAVSPRLIYHVDKVTASIVADHLVVVANGAVSTGGWNQPHLLIANSRKADADTEVLDFLATPPSPDAIVIQALVPVSSTQTLALPPHGVTHIKVVAQTNSIVVAIAPAH